VATLRYANFADAAMLSDSPTGLASPVAPARDWSADGGRGELPSRVFTVSVSMPSRLETVDELVDAGRSLEQIEADVLAPCAVA